MAARLVTKLDRLKAAVKKFESAQAKYAEFGARDTELDGVFQWHLAQAVNGKKVTMPTSGRDWQLFTSSMKCGTAARALTTALRAAVLVIQGCTVKELPTIREYLKDYCWRTVVD